jgi:hypothetical protein
MRLKGVGSGARFLKELTEATEALLREFSSRASYRDSDFIDAVKRFNKKRFPSTRAVNRLLSFTKSADEGVRCDAARAIVRLGPVLLQLSAFDDAVARAVFGAIKNNNSEVRHTMLGALKWFAKPSHPQCAQAFDLAIGALKDKDHPLIRATSLNVIEAFGVDRMSSAVQNIAEALSDESPEVRQLACNLLGELGADARPAINGLLVRAAKDDEEISVRVAAATAIVKVVEALDRVDPGHQHLDLGPADAPLLGGLLTALREAGPVGRKLRQRLQHRLTRAATDEAMLPANARPPANEAITNAPALEDGRLDEAASAGVTGRPGEVAAADAGRESIRADSPPADAIRRTRARKEKWWHEAHENPPPEWPFGPLVGTAADLARAADPQQRKSRYRWRDLEPLAGHRVWVRREKTREWEVFFRSKHEFDAADSRLSQFRAEKKEAKKSQQKPRKASKGQLRPRVPKRRRK